jgi:ABC-type transport system involved in cytochrome bd biosynthesis fused ATPase/permease subunit
MQQFLRLVQCLCIAGSQVSDKLKESVPDEIKDKAREMARQELQRRLDDLDMTAADAKSYGSILTAISTHLLSLHNLLERKLFVLASFCWFTIISM